METCLENIIRLSRTECECFDTDKPSDYNEGQSQVYLDELDGLDLKTLKGAEACGPGGIWDMMQNSRENATLMFKADILAGINESFKSKRPAYSGIIGKTAFTNSLNLSANTAGAKISFPRIKNGTIKIKRIGLIFNASVGVTIDVYDNDQNQTTPIASYSINSVADNVEWATLSTPLELNLWSENTSRLEYYFVYNRTGFQPKNNKGDCGCGGIIPAWRNWINIEGIKGNGTNYQSFSTSAELNGIVLDAELKCNNTSLICSDSSPLDFDGDGIAMHIAYCIRYKAGEMLLEKILASSNINRYVLLDREALWGKRNHYRKQYNDYIQYLVNTIDVDGSDCLVCRGNKNISVHTIKL